MNFTEAFEIDRLVCNDFVWDSICVHNLDEDPEDLEDSEALSNLIDSEIVEEDSLEKGDIFDHRLIKDEMARRDTELKSTQV